MQSIRLQNVIALLTPSLAYNVPVGWLNLLSSMELSAGRLSTIAA